MLKGPVSGASTSLGGDRLARDLSDIAANVRGGLGVRLPEGGLDSLHVVLRPVRKLRVGNREELQRADKADVGDRRPVAADEAGIAEEELRIDLQVAREVGLGRL